MTKHWYTLINWFLRTRFAIIWRFFPNKLQRNPSKYTHRTLAFEDKFDKLNPNYNFHYPWGTTHLQVHNHVFTHEAVNIRNGNLHLSAHKQTAQGWVLNEQYPNGIYEFEKPYIAGYIDSSKVFSQAYGRWEIRCQIAKGIGIWPAFWLVEFDRWPPEIDVMEVFGHTKPQNNMTNHFVAKQTKGMIGTKVVIPTMYDSMHVYGVEWRKGKLKWYIDGILCGISGIGVSDRKMHFIVNNAVTLNPGPPRDNDVPNALIVDWIRVYE